VLLVWEHGVNIEKGHSELLFDDVESLELMDLKVLVTDSDGVDLVEWVNDGLLSSTATADFEVIDNSADLDVLVIELWLDESDDGADKSLEVWEHKDDLPVVVLLGSSELSSEGTVVGSEKVSESLQENILNGNGSHDLSLSDGWTRGCLNVTFGSRWSLEALGTDLTANIKRGLCWGLADWSLLHLSFWSGNFNGNMVGSIISDLDATCWDGWRVIDVNNALNLRGGLLVGLWITTCEFYDTSRHFHDKKY
jgi:hypothetical protein